MNTLALALTTSLLASPAASKSGTTVYRPPIAVTGTVSNADRTALRGRVDDEFARTDFESAKPADASVCSTAACWQAQAEASGSRYIATVTVNALEADQRLAISIVDLVDGNSVVDLEQTCELCGRDELRDATADLAAAALRKLQSHAAIATVVSVDSIPSGAAVMLDGVAVGETPLHLEVSPGLHTVELSAAGHDSFSQEVDIARGTTLSVRPRLSETAPSRLGDNAAGSRRRGRIIAGTALIVGGVAAAATGTTLMVLHGRPITSDCSGSEVDGDGDCRFLHDTRTGGIIGLSAGVAALVGGAVLVGLELRRGRPGTVALSPTPSGLLLHGRF
ncbi:MAG: PEGA domain-containing protein [Nannocystales bacterium]